MNWPGDNTQSAIYSDEYGASMVDNDNNNDAHPAKARDRGMPGLS